MTIMTIRRTSAKIQYIAYHEAGHAVVALREGVAFRYVTILPSGDAEGHLKHFAAVRDPDLLTDRDNSPKLLFYLMKRIRVALAGDIAGRRFSPRSFRTYQGLSDRHNAIDLAEKFFDGNSKILEARMKVFYLETEAIIDLCWSQVVAIAQALLERKKITGREARVLRNDAIAAKIRRAEAERQAIQFRR